MKRNVMKKLLSVFMAAWLLLSVAYAEPNPATFLYGTWARCIEYSDGEYSMTLFHIYPNHTAFYVSKWFDGKEIESSTDELIQWSFESGTFYLFFENGRLALTPTGEFTLKEGESSGVMYNKIYPRKLD